MLSVLTLGLALHAPIPASHSAAPLHSRLRFAPLLCSADADEAAATRAAPAAAEAAAAAASPALAERGLTGELITYSSLSSDMQALVQVREIGQ